MQTTTSKKAHIYNFLRLNPHYLKKDVYAIAAFLNSIRHEGLSDYTAEDVKKAQNFLEDSDTYYGLETTKEDEAPKKKKKRPLSTVGFGEMINSVDRKINQIGDIDKEISILEILLKERQERRSKQR